MGTIPIDLARELASAHGITDAVETGTFLGTSTRLLAKHFDRVTTIELSRLMAWRARIVFATRRNVRVLRGDSSKLLWPASSPTLYWLDAHWSSGITAGKETECPLLDEIRMTSPGHPSDCYLIDDARLFLEAPPPPHKAEQWPTFDEICAVARTERPDHTVAVARDVIVIAPREVRP
jgi:hypothetical protein